MAGFVYFFEDIETLPSVAGIPPECGLDGVFEDASFESARVFNGPDGKSGLAISIQPPKGGSGARAGYWPDRQTWRKVERKEGESLVTTHWLGIENDSPPRPEDLLRERAVGGFSVKSRLGSEWRIPCLHLPVEQRRFPTHLPVVCRYEGGEIVGRVDNRYEVICADAARLKDDIPRSLESEWWPFVVRLLGINYRIGVAEASALGIIDSQNWRAYLACAYGDAAIVEEESEKKRADTPPSSSSESPAARD